MSKKIFFPAVAVIGIASASAFAWWYQNRPNTGPTVVASAPASGVAPAASGAASGRARPVPVEAARVESSRITDDAQAVGSLRSRQSVMLRPEVSGRVATINFRDGDRVKRGQLMVQLDDQLPQAQVQQATAELSIAQANHKRNQELVAQNFVSQRSLDESGANLQVAQAKLALARASAERLKILAPFDGYTGIRSVNVGDYLKDGADIVNVEDIEAIYVDFRLPERVQSKLRKGQRTAVDVDALPGRKFDGLVLAIDPLLDANGRSVGVRACIDNRQLQLRPGMFAKVNTVFGERANALVVPEEAVVPQGGRQFVIKLVPGPEEQSQVSQRVEVKLGIRRPGRVEITQGVALGDLVVTAGQQRLQRDASVVRVVDTSRSGGPGGPGGGPARPTDAASAPDPSGAARGSASASAASGPGAASSAARGLSPRLRPAVASGPNPCLVGLGEGIDSQPGRPGGDRAPPSRTGRPGG